MFAAQMSGYSPLKPVVSKLRTFSIGEPIESFTFTVAAVFAALSPTPFWATYPVDSAPMLKAMRHRLLTHSLRYQALLLAELMPQPLNPNTLVISFLQHLAGLPSPGIFGELYDGPEQPGKRERAAPDRHPWAWFAERTE